VFLTKLRLEPSPQQHLVDAVGGGRNSPRPPTPTRLENLLVTARIQGPIRVGVVGCGIIADAHLPYIKKAGGVVVGAADPSLRVASDLADRHAIQRTYRSAEELFDVEKPNVVHVLTPPHTHADVAVAALERGIHTLVEKPLALTMADTERMVAAASRGNAVLTADHNRLFDPPMLEARRLVDEGALGEIVAIESYQAGAASERSWLSRLAGGGIGDLVPHPLYLQLAFLGPVLNVQAHAFGSDGNPRELRVLMQGEGRSGSLTISTGANPGLNTLKLCGTKMTVEVNLNNMSLVRRRDYAVPKIIAKPLPNLDEASQLVKQTLQTTVNFLRGTVRYYPGMGTLIERFYQSLREGTEPPVTTAQAVDVVAATEKIWAAVRESDAAAARVAAAGE
jgi:predicted dehydrogenase